MRKFLIFLIVIFAASCKPKTEAPLYPETAAEEPSGKALFESTGNCVACHQPEQKVIGPGLKEIALTYKLQKGAIVKFLRGDSEPIVDPSQYDVMKTNFAITKMMSDAELTALENYIYSFAK